jgi:hypothetical protein
MALLADLHQQIDKVCYYVEGVACGPDPTTVTGCCYEAVVTPYCEGRPFTVDGRAVAARVTARADWAAPLAPDVSRLNEPTLSALAAAWGRDARYEHASIASFARFALELLSVGAPAALLAEAHRAIGDEIRHAELCFGLAAAYAGAPLGPGKLAMEGALDGRADLAAIAVAAVREGCVGETVAALVAEAMRDAAEDPAVRHALGRIANDEVAHAALAWRFVTWALAQAPDEIAGPVAAAFAEHALPALGEADGSDVDHAAMRAHGRLPEGEVRAIAARAYAEVILPCARAMQGGRPCSPATSPQ